jgi:hypothetical protein
MNATPTWPETLKAAAMEVYGCSCNEEFNAVDLDDYRGMDPIEAIEAIVRDAKIVYDSMSSLEVES